MERKVKGLIILFIFIIVLLTGCKNKEEVLKENVIDILKEAAPIKYVTEEIKEDGTKEVNYSGISFNIPARLEGYQGTYSNKETEESIKISANKVEYTSRKATDLDNIEWYIEENTSNYILVESYVKTDRVDIGKESIIRIEIEIKSEEVERIYQGILDTIDSSGAYFEL